MERLERKKSSPSQSTSARNNNSLSPYRTFLVDLSDNLSIEDLEKLKFVGLDVVPRGEMEKVTAGFKLFYFLEQKGTITPQNITFLENMMQAIKRSDLASKVNQFMNDKYNEMKFDHDGMETRQFCCKCISLVVCLIMSMLNIWLYRRQGQFLR